MNDVLWPFAAALGAAVGSFLNVVADRAPAGKSIVKPPSHCPGCQRRLAAYDMIPIVSYLVLRGRCRTCGRSIPLRVLAVELAAASLFALAYLRFGATLEMGITVVFGAFFMLLFVTDFEHALIPNRIIFPAIALGLLAIPFRGENGQPSLLIGGVLAFGVLFAIAALSPRGMGMGDVKLGAFMGLALGFPEIVPALLLSFVIGGLIVGGLWLAGRVKRDDHVPFGPYLAAVGLIFLLYGNMIVDWWLTRL
jgi:leader peptidase (prepilin peptidase)/N-methyltransferase